MAQNYGSLRRLTARHKRAIDLLCAGQGNQEIAKRLKVTAGTVSGWTASPLFQDELSKRLALAKQVQQEDQVTASARAQMVLEEGSVRAAEVLVKLVEDEDADVAIRACKTVLDLGLPKLAPNAPRGGMFTPEFLQRIEIVIAESASCGGLAATVTVSQTVPAQAAPAKLPEITDAREPAAAAAAVPAGVGA